MNFRFSPKNIFLTGVFFLLFCCHFRLLFFRGDEGKCDLSSHRKKGKVENFSTRFSSFLVFDFEHHVNTFVSAMNRDFFLFPPKSPLDLIFTRDIDLRVLLNFLREDDWKDF